VSRAKCSRLRATGEENTATSVRPSAGAAAVPCAIASASPGTSVCAAAQAGSSGSLLPPAMPSVCRTHSSDSTCPSPRGPVFGAAGSRNAYSPAVTAPESVSELLGLDIPAELRPYLDPADPAPRTDTPRTDAPRTDEPSEGADTRQELERELTQGMLTETEHWRGGPALQLERTVTPTGNITVGRQQIWIGGDHAGRTIGVWVDTTTIHLTYDPPRRSARQDRALPADHHPPAPPAHRRSRPRRPTTRATHRRPRRPHRRSDRGRPRRQRRA